MSVIVFHLTFRFETAQARRTSKRTVCGGLYTLQGYCMTRVESLADTTSMTSRTAYSTQTTKKSTLFSGQYFRNHWTLDIGVLGYIGIVWRKEHSPEVWSVPPVTPCILNGGAERTTFTYPFINSYWLFYFIVLSYVISLCFYVWLVLIVRGQVCAVGVICWIVCVFVHSVGQIPSHSTEELL